MIKALVVGELVGGLVGTALACWLVVALRINSPVAGSGNVVIRLISA